MSRNASAASTAGRSSGGRSLLSAQLGILRGLCDRRAALVGDLEHGALMKVYPDAQMTDADASNEIRAAHVEQQLETLQRHVSDLTRKADVATQTYERTAWNRYGAIWVPIPFVVLLFRLHMQVWHYYLAGALFLAVGLALYAMDLAAVAKRDKAIQAAERAQKAYEVARMSQRDAG